MAKLFTRIYCEDTVLNVPGHIEYDIDINANVFYEGSDLNAKVINVLEGKGVCEVSVFYFRYLDFPDSPDEPTTEEDLIAIDSSFADLSNEDYIVCDNDCVVSIRYWVNAEGQVNFETMLKEFEDDNEADNEIVEYVE